MWGDECAQCVLAAGMGLSTVVYEQQSAARNHIAD